MNEELASRNQDLEELLAFGSGLAERALDREALVDFAEGAVARLADGPAIVVRDAETAGEPLLAGGERLGTLVLPHTSDRWDRLDKMIVPQLATALESAELLERVRRTHLATIAALSRSMEAKDVTTGNHTERVAELAVGIARRLGFAGDDLEAIEVGALLHDIGKVGIPERILEKPGPLDDEEWTIMRRHPVISDYILSEIDLHPAVRAIARWSHERIDGAGYPDGLAGDEIPVPARIVLVADAFDALTSDRPYRAARGVDEALAELRAHTGTQFAPEVVEALESLLTPPLREAVGA
jgi:putative nucleotidyltransferase with HDIG domain